MAHHSTVHDFSEALEVEVVFQALLLLYVTGEKTDSLFLASHIGAGIGWQASGHAVTWVWDLHMPLLPVSPSALLDGPTGDE